MNKSNGKYKLSNMNQCLIYKITCNDTGKVYVGQTWQKLLYRWTQHKQSKQCIKLYNAIQKYGQDNFKVELLTVCGTQETANYWEQSFIEKFDTINSGYNLKTGGSNGKPSQSTIEKRAAALRGRKASPETKEKLSQSHKGQAAWNKGLSIPWTKARRDAQDRRYISMITGG